MPDENPIKLASDGISLVAEVIKAADQLEAMEMDWFRLFCFI